MKGDTKIKSTAPKILAFVAGEPQSTRENIGLNDSVQTDWVSFFRDNDNTFPNNLALRARRSPTHGAIINSKRIYTVGNGFLFKKNNDLVEVEDLESSLQDFILKANDKMQGLFQVFSEAALNFITTGNAYVEVVKADNITSVFNKDSTKMRINKERTKAFMSGFWREIKNEIRPNQKQTPVKTLDLWDNEIDTSEQRFIIHIKQDSLEFDFYGIPEHHNVLKWADIEYQIPTFNLGRFKNGFFPSVQITMIGQPPEGKTPEEYVKSIARKFTGENNNAKILVNLVESRDQAAIIQEFTGAKDGEFVDLDKLASQRIISGHRWFPSLSGLMVAGQLGSNQQIINEWKIAMNSLVIPEYRTPLLNLFNLILKIAGFDLILDVISKPPIGLDIDAQKVLLIDEQRAELGRKELENEEGKRLLPERGVRGQNN